jgi:hypothetical protein
MRLAQILEEQWETLVQLFILAGHTRFNAEYEANKLLGRRPKKQSERKVGE